MYVCIKRLMQFDFNCNSAIFFYVIIWYFFYRFIPKLYKVCECIITWTFQILLNIIRNKFENVNGKSFLMSRDLVERL